MAGSGGVTSVRYYGNRPPSQDRWDALKPPNSAERLEHFRNGW